MSAEQDAAKWVFLSWSGEESKQIAVELKYFLENLLQPSLHVFMSDIDTPTGKKGVEELSKILSVCNYGICLVNRENARAPWIHYEAGAIAKESPISKLIILLLDDDYSSIMGTPLSDFKYLRFNRSGILDIVDTMIDICGGSNYNNIIHRRFETFWADYEKKCREIMNEFRKEKKEEEKKEVAYDLEPTMDILMEIRNYIKTDIGNSIKKIDSVASEWKNVLSSEKDLSLMQIKYKNGRYEKLLSKTVAEIDEVIVLLEKYAKDGYKDKSDKIVNMIEALKDLHEELNAQIFD